MSGNSNKHICSDCGSTKSKKFWNFPDNNILCNECYDRLECQNLPKDYAIYFEKINTLKDYNLKYKNKFRKLEERRILTDSLLPKNITTLSFSDQFKLRFNLRKNKKYAKLEKESRSFNWGAFIFEPFYFLYKKLYGVAIGIFVFGLIIGIIDLLFGISLSLFSGLAMSMAFACGYVTNEALYTKDVLGNNVILKRRETVSEKKKRYSIGLIILIIAIVIIAFVSILWVWPTQHKTELYATTDTDFNYDTYIYLAPNEKLSTQELLDSKSSIENRLNIYDLPGSVSIEDETIIVGIDSKKLETYTYILTKVKFEAKIGNETIFRGGNKDIAYVCTTASCSGITQESCTSVGENESYCRFRFSITLTEDAANRQAAATEKLNIIYIGSEAFLDKNVSLYLDDKLVDELRIGVDLKGKPITEVSISGSGVGSNIEEAYADALNNMKNLQKALIMDDMPHELYIVKIE